MSIVFVFSATGTLEKNIRDSIAKIGDNSLFIQKWPWAFNDPNYAWWEYYKRPEPKIHEMENLKRRVTGAESVAFISSVVKNIKYEGKMLEGIEIVGASHDFSDVWNFELSHGRYFTPTESSAGKNVCLVGAEIADQFFNEQDVVGRKIRVFNRKATIAGVFKREGNDDFGETMDNQVIIPVQHYRKFVDLNSNRVGSVIIVKAKENVTNAELADELRGVMRAIRKLKAYMDDDFAINEANILTSGIDSIFRIISIAGWIIGGFSLLVGGFSIANIMFVSVKERTHQIGIQKSLGAKRYFILLQFLCESISLSLIGGLIGLLITWLCTLLISNTTDFPMVMSSGNFVFGLSISIIIGILAGIIPAWSAAKLDPVVAIRTHF